MSNRVEKGNSLLQKEISNIISNKLNDPRLNNEIISLTKVSLSNDLSYAKVFVSIYGAKNEEESLKAIKSASGFIRKELATKLKFRILPTLDFELDTSGEYSQRINELLKNIKYSSDNDLE